ncbi:SCO2400 family protein [Streptomyces sp. enrichment culture]|uniref:SCO2400 family protein n=1 Tax=Streptomyces sp. enrichment culture TaxID=1795815 RepID=UPI003F55DB3F
MVGSAPTSHGARTTLLPHRTARTARHVHVAKVSRAPPTPSRTKPGKPVDYCITCRRHLNGALTCPGCGEVTSWQQPHQDPPASPTAVDGHGSDHATPGRHSGTAPGSGSQGRHLPQDSHDGGYGGDDPERPEHPDDSPATPPAGGRRADRRGKRHASRPRKGRRYVLGAVLGIVAVGVLVAEVGEVRLPLQREQPADSDRVTDAASESSGTEEDGEATDDTASGGGDTAAGPSGNATATAGESGSPADGDDGETAGRDEDDPDADEDARDGAEESAGESPPPDASSSGRVSPPPSDTGAPTEGASPDPTETAPGEEEPSSPPPPDDSAGGGDGDGDDDGDDGNNGGGGSCWLWWCS